MLDSIWMWCGDGPRSNDPEAIWIDADLDQPPTVPVGFSFPAFASIPACGELAISLESCHGFFVGAELHDQNRLWPTGWGSSPLSSDYNISEAITTIMSAKRTDHGLRV